MVLYNASDVLHNGLDVAGLELDHFFIPRVYYTDINEHSETAFGNEAAEMKLRRGTSRQPMKVKRSGQSIQNGAISIKPSIRTPASASAQFLAGLHVLFHWPSAIGSKDLSFSYSASREKVRDVLVASVTDMSLDEADKVISLASLDPKRIRRLWVSP